DESVCWMSHTDYVKTVPAGFTTTASTGQCPCAAMADEARKLYAVQFHPEVTHTEYGKQILRNFLFTICGCAGDWTMEDFVTSTVEKYRRELAGRRALCALSGGVDSAVAAVLLHRAIGDRLTCVFVDHGLLRKGEREQVVRVFQHRFQMKLIVVDARERFLARLKGITEPERKRKIIGEEFIRVFEEEAAILGKQDVLVQGTIYPDVVESGAGSAAVIKSHHNVGGLPEKIGFEHIVEPLRELFKDEVRAVGLELGIPEELVMRQPFPGPGLAIRVMGEITEEKLTVLREADAIFREEIMRAGLADAPSQYFVVLTDNRSVGVMGDARTYGWTVALRAVSTDDFMTADWSRLPWELLERASSRITNEVRSVSRVVYDITSKPPATVEWE
ncbi:MAG: glutamine-hydrolyzing GMP synthase, partial [Clostridia bacterium]|nr:glutamine-hydrolyzing GMP synthase [Clostridia bacterium]